MSLALHIDIPITQVNVVKMCRGHVGYLLPLTECMKIYLLQIILGLNIIWSLYKGFSTDTKILPMAQKKKHKEEHIKA